MVIAQLSIEIYGGVQFLRKILGGKQMKKLTTQATITSVTNQENENSIIQSVLAFINHTNNVFLSCEKINDIKTALSEAINNAITFAYQNKQGKVSVSISIYDNNVLKLKVRDYGCGIENIAKAREPLFTTQNERSGMGFTIMESFSDKLTVKSTTGKGTIVTMDFQM